MSLIQALSRLKNEVNEIVREALQDSFQILDLYIDDNMNLGTRPKAGNSTDKLYVNTGRLKRSFTVGGAEGIQRLKVGSNGVVLEYGTKVEYGIFNELGTKNAKARPFLIPAVQRYFEDDIAELENIVTDKLRRLFV
jgi:HK97 gp10 family phage protein